MNLHFTKYQGTGNDFIIIDNRERQFDNLNVAALCHPKFGIGADGLMLLQHLEGYDFEMVYYNSDGNISSMCGNGGRCIVDFARHIGVFHGDIVHFKAIDGPHEAVWSRDWIELKMQDVDWIDHNRQGHYVLNTGSPHYVIFANDIRLIDIIPSARQIRNNDMYKAYGINVNFVEIVNDSEIRVRTYERGVENETLSCGTGVTASAIALSRQLPSAPGFRKVSISTPGGELEVKYQAADQVTDVWLCGPATKVFEGDIRI